MRRAASFVLCATATLGMGACGDGGDDEASAGGDGISQADVQDAGVKYARCMREHGIDMPDPKAGLGGLRGLMTDRDLEGQPGFREVEGDCRKHLEGLAPQISDEQREEIFDPGSSSRGACVTRDSMCPTGSPAVAVAVGRSATSTSRTRGCRPPWTRVGSRRRPSWTTGEVPRDPPAPALAGHRRVARA